MKTKRNTKFIKMLAGVLVAFALVVVMGAVALNAYLDRAAEQSVESIRTAVLNAAAQCAAVEGSYPQTLKYLEDEYGLVINHAQYVVQYETFASNVAPSVVVRLR